MRDRVFRGLVLGYVALVWLAAWPFEDVPILGSASAHARKAMQAATVLPGMTVFTGSADRYKIYANCLAVNGRDADGAWHALYRNPCPGRGFIWRQDPIDHMMQHVTRTGWTALLKAREPLKPTIADSVRRFVALGDYFCHSELVDAPPRREVALRNRMLLNRYEDGEVVFSPTLECLYSCRRDVVAVPRCERQMIGADGQVRGQ